MKGCASAGWKTRITNCSVARSSSSAGCPFDRSSMTRWRQRMGEDKLVALLQASGEPERRRSHRHAAKPADFANVIADTTVQPKAVAFPTDAKLMHRA
jgi:transposase, IS5 family